MPGHGTGPIRSGRRLPVLYCPLKCANGYTAARSRKPCWLGGLLKDH
jgi:hypothetical protein